MSWEGNYSPFMILGIYKLRNSGVEIHRSLRGHSYPALANIILNHFFTITIFIVILDRQKRKAS